MRNDTLVSRPGADVLKGGIGADYASYATATTAATASLASAAANTGEAISDTYDSIEHVEGSQFNDTLIGDTGNNSLRGGLDADRLEGGASSDTASLFRCLSGRDRVIGQPWPERG